MHIFADGITKISFSNNNVRFTMVQIGPGNDQNEIGTLIVPVNQAANFVNAMANGLKQLDEQMKAKQAEGPPAEGEIQ